MLLEYLAYIILGTFSGTLAGLLGIGGGIIIVPGLVFLFHSLGFPQAHLMKLVAGTSLAIMAPTVIASAYSHHQRQLVNWNIVAHFGPGLVLGTMMGALLASKLPNQILEIILSLFLIAVGIRFLLPSHEPHHPDQRPHVYASIAFSIFVGLMSGLLGLGGGLLMIPFLTYAGVPFGKASGVAAACTIPVTFVGVSTFIWLGYHQPITAGGATGFVYWPAVLVISIFSTLSVSLGGILARSLPVSILKQIFGVILILTAITILF